MARGERVTAECTGMMNLPFDKISKYLAIGLEIPSTILGAVVLGYFADSYLGSGPWLTVGFSILGFVGAVFRLIKYADYFSKHGKN
jgi:F0F1-type ATP synthase assembly protein I